MHEHRMPSLKPKYSVLVVSSTKTKETDTSGKEIIKFLESEDLEVVNYGISDDDANEIKGKVTDFLTNSDAVIISGGTGISSRDVTIEAVRSISEKEIHGFSTIFSLLSFNEIGVSAIMSGSSAYVVGGKPVFCLPGSPKGALLGTKEIVVKEIDHIIHELNK